MSSLSKVRLSDGRELAVSEWLHDPRFSTALFAAGDNFRLDLFNYTKGNRVSRTANAPIRTATEADTNQTRKRMMNQDEALVVYAIAYELFQEEVSPQVFPPVLDNSAPAPLVSHPELGILQQELVLELKVGAGIKKPQVELPLAHIGMSIDTHCHTTALVPGAAIASAGSATPQNQHKLNLPVYIGGTGQNARPGNTRIFGVSLRSNTPPPITQNGSIRVTLDGLRKRPA